MHTISKQLLLCCLQAAIAIALAVAPAPARTAEAARLTATATLPQGCTDPWRQVASRTIGGGLTILNDVVARTPDDIWAVGTKAAVSSSGLEPLIQHWDGSAWDPVPTPTIAVGGNLNAVAARQGELWAVGAQSAPDGSSTLVLRWDGQDWALVPSPNTAPQGINTLHDIAAAPGAALWAVGDNGGQPIIMRWDGAQWALVSYPDLGPDNASLRSIAVVGANDVWAVGWSAANSTTPLILHWDGVTWSQVAGLNYPTAELSAVAARSTDDIWAVGTRLAQPFILHWDGAQWSETPAPMLELGSNELLDVVALARDNVWAIGRGSYRPIALHWDGQSWVDVSPARSMAGDEDLRAIAALGSGNLWAVGFSRAGFGKTVVKQYAPALSFVGSSVDRAPGGGTATADVRLSSSTVHTVTVSYATSDAGAVAGQDYASSSGTLTIPPCSTAATISIPLLDNPSWRPLAEVVVTLSGPQHAVLGAQPSVRIDITDMTKAPGSTRVALPILQRAPMPSGPSRIAYVGVADVGAVPNWDIWTMLPDGTDRRRLTSGPARDYDPAWSPDGQWIAFVSERSGSPGIYIMRADGSQLRQLSSNGRTDRSPSWSPDGQRIVFASEQRSRLGVTQQLLFTMRVDGSQITPLTTAAPGTNQVDDEPDWSPNGQTIVFTSGRDQLKEIYAIGAGGGTARRLTTNDYPDEAPAWSPDGGHIAYFARLLGYPNIIVMGSDGSGGRIANHNFDTGSSPTWSPDGTQLAFDGGYREHLSLVSLDGGEPVRLERIQSTEFYPDWSPPLR